jgi:hypothetical protein
LEEKEVLPLAGGHVNDSSHYENQKKLKIKFSYDPAIALLDIYPKESKSAYYRDHRDICISMFIMALFRVTKLWSQMDKEHYA